MTTFTETLHAGAFIISEGNGSISRERVIVSSGQNLKAGAVVGKITATGEYAKYDNGASDGTEVAAGVLYAAVDATSADKPGVIIARLAEVAKSGLIYDAGQDATAQAAALVDLKALNIIAR